MEAYSSTRPYGSNHYDFPQDPVTEREPYKVNKVALAILLCLGIAPGLLYLIGVGIANCMGGREITVQQQDYSYGTFATHQTYQQTIGRRPRKTSTNQRAERSDFVDRASTRRLDPNQSAIPKKTRPNHPKRSSSGDNIDTNMNWISRNIPAHLQEFLGEKGDWLSTGEQKPLGAHLPNIRLTSEMKSQILREAQNKFIIHICSEEGCKYMEKVTGSYPDVTEGTRDYNRCKNRVFKWAADTYEDVIRSLGDGINQPVDHREIRQQFQAIMNQKLIDFNMRQLEKKIPDLFTNPAYQLDIRSDWIPNKQGMLGEFMMAVPFIPSAINHIKAKLQQQVIDQQQSRQKAQERRGEQLLGDFIRGLKRQSDPQILGLPDDRRLSRNEIVKAYRKQALKFHPDKLPLNLSVFEHKKGEETFKRITEAHTKLMSAYGYN